MRTFKFNKLVRDNDCDRMKDLGFTVNIKKLSKNESIIEYYKEKLIEESKEVLTAKTHDEFVEEVADLVEVIHGLLKQADIDFSEIESARLAKKQARGGFDTASIVDNVDLEDNNKWVKHYLGLPDKYPEVV
jgi:predicted house-cleaning noncanonical NTP pyrophosphatase (MazG superfamily)